MLVPPSGPIPISSITTFVNNTGSFATLTWQNDTIGSDIVTSFDVYAYDVNSTSINSNQLVASLVHCNNSPNLKTVCSTETNSMIISGLYFTHTYIFQVYYF